MQMNELQQAMTKAKVGLMLNKKLVFFTTILFSLKFKWDDTQPTAWVDGYTFGCNPEFFLKASLKQRIFVMFHEAAHIALDHIGRLLGRDRGRWNRACDHVINLMAKDMGLEMWDWVLCDVRFRGMNADQVYRILEQEEQHNPPPPNPMEDIRPAPAGTDPKAFKKHIEDIIIRASVQAQMDKQEPGYIPGDVQLFLNKLLNPRLPWQTILRREVTQYAKSGYSWMKPNRRFFPDHHLPSKWARAPQSMRFYVDISGSVLDHQFMVFVSEIAGVMRMFTPKEVTIIQFDDVIQSTHRVRNLRELMSIKFRGRGGTDVGPVLEDIEANGADLNMIFTDGEFEWYDHFKPKKRILWLINDNPEWEAPTGRAIHFNTKEM